MEQCLVHGLLPGFSAHKMDRAQVIASTSRLLEANGHFVLKRQTLGDWRVLRLRSFKKRYIA